MAAGYCSGLSAVQMAEVGRGLRFKDFARWTLERGGFCSNDRLGAFLTRTVPCKDFCELQTPLVVVATELLSGKPAIFREGPICEAIRASCAYPGMFTPVEINGVLHVDGMLSYEVPTTPLKEMGMDCVLGVHLQSRWNPSKAPRHFFDVIGQCFAIAQTRMSLQWEKDADLLLHPNVDDFAFDDFDRGEDASDRRGDDQQEDKMLGDCRQEEDEEHSPHDEQHQAAFAVGVLAHCATPRADPISAARSITVKREAAGGGPRRWTGAVRSRPASGV